MPPKTKKQTKLTNEPTGELINFYELQDVQAFSNKSHNPYFHIHNIKIPFRAIVVGASGGGKTLTVTNLINTVNNTFNKIELYCKSSAEPLYEYLQTKIDTSMLKVEEGLEGFNGQNLNETYKKDENTLIIFDDLMLEKKQKSIEEAYIRGRKIGLSLMYLTQKYFQVPKTIRGQVNYIYIKKVAGKGDLRRILAETSLGASVEALYNMYKFCIEGNIASFLLIDLEAPEDRQYRRGFLEYLNWRAFE